MKSDRIKYDVNEIIEEIKELKGIDIKKFMTEVRKIYKKRTTTTLWYGYSEELMEKYNLKSKDEYAIIKGSYRLFKTWDDNTESLVYKECNFRVIPIGGKYSATICLNLEVKDRIVIIKDAFIYY